MVAGVSPQTAALARARGYLGPGPCAGGVQPLLKRVVAVAGDVVEIGPAAVFQTAQLPPATVSGASYRMR